MSPERRAAGPLLARDRAKLSALTPVLIDAAQRRRRVAALDALQDRLSGEGKRFDLLRGGGVPARGGRLGGGRQAPGTGVWTGFPATAAGARRVYPNAAGWATGAACAKAAGLTRGAAREGLTAALSVGATAFGARLPPRPND